MKRLEAEVKNTEDSVSVLFTFNTGDEKMATGEVLQCLVALLMGANEEIRKIDPSFPIMTILSNK